MIDKSQLINLNKLFNKFNDYRILLSYQLEEAINSVELSLKKTDESFKNIEKWCKENNQVGNEKKHMLSFRCGEIIDLRAKDPQILPIGFLESNFETKKEYLEELVNQIHLWYLAWCFEKYEMLLKEVYVVIGRLDHNYWLASDFGSVKMGDIANGTWQDFEKQIFQSTRYDANYLRKRFADISPSIIESEKVQDQFFYQYNYFWYISYITQLRHHIVHTQGKIFSLDKFNEKLQQITGLNNNTDFERFLAEHNNMYLKKNGDIFSINMLDNTPDINSKKYQILSQHLGNHAYLLVASIYDILKI